nr:hypothetical protein TSUD_267140 [Ipomoea batatas]
MMMVIGEAMKEEEKEDERTKNDGDERDRVFVLLQRRVEIPPDCPLCHKEVESRSHLFLDYDENKSRSIIAILWTVWKNRNEYVWNNKQWNVNAIRISVTNCIKDWQCWCDLQKANTSSIPLQTVQRTQGIDASWVYCEVDASVIENSASFGAVIRTHSGLFLAAISGPLRPISDSNKTPVMLNGATPDCRRLLVEDAKMIVVGAVAKRGRWRLKLHVLG